jgi:hypothetical protein
MRRSCVGVGCCRSHGPGHHNLAWVGFCGEVVPGQDLVFEGREEGLGSGVIET